MPVPRPNKGPLVENWLLDDAWRKYMFTKEKKCRQSAEKKYAELIEKQQNHTQATLLRTQSGTALKPAPEAWPEKPNAERYLTQNRFKRMTMVTQDGRGKLLSRVYLNGEWVYCA
ncbi:unnamed protein product [Amoebophrya sp. A120]|nr:unnamed protein product [Amoebophrya sp. A120]|eukprot:GSA120T00007252001.1